MVRVLKVPGLGFRGLKVPKLGFRVLKVPGIGLRVWGFVLGTGFDFCRF